MGGKPIRLGPSSDHSGQFALLGLHAGNSLRFSAMGYTHVTIEPWNGESLEFSLRRQTAP